VAQLAQLISCLQDVQMSAEYERDYEGDNSVIPERLEVLIEDAGLILCDMCEEEMGEITEAEKTAFADVIGNVAFLRNEISKAREARKTAEKPIEKVVAPVVDERLEKALSTVNTLTAQVEKLNTDFTKAADDLKNATAVNDQLNKRVKALEAQPATPKGSLKTMEKATDANGSGDGQPGEIKPVLKADGTIDQEATAIKKARASQPIKI